MTSTSISNRTDKQLLGQFRREGSRECLGELYRRYRHIMLGIAIKYMNDGTAGKDVVLDIFERLMCSKESNLPEVSNVRAWLCAITRNYCIDQLRHKQAVEEKKLSVVKFLYAENMEIDPIERRINNDLIMQREDSLNAALKKLKDDHRECIHLFYFSGMTYREIADNTGLSIKQVKSNLQNGKLSLKRILQNC